MNQDRAAGGRPTDLPQPVRAVAARLQRVPGAGVVTRAADGALDAIGVVSPRGRRYAVYAGAGLLGVAGAVEWPLALTGAAVAWLTQPKTDERQARPEAEPGTTTDPGAAVTEPDGPDKGTTGPDGTATEPGATADAAEGHTAEHTPAEERGRATIARSTVSGKAPRTASRRVTATASHTSHRGTAAARRKGATSAARKGVASSARNGSAPSGAQATRQQMNPG